MSRNPTTNPPDPTDSPGASSAMPARRSWPRALAELAAAMLLGALLIALAYQLPVTHTVDIGGADAAYVQGFYDPERGLPGQPVSELAGSDGSARWSREQSFLVFPQAGLPARLTLRLRGPDAPAAGELLVLLNGAQELGRIALSSEWQERSFAVAGGLLKPSDVVIELRAATVPRAPDDPRQVGALLDRATLAVGPAPITPYPAQLLGGALAAGLLWLLCRRLPGERGLKIGDPAAAPPRRSAPFNPQLSKLGAWQILAIGLLALSLAFLLLYRAQPAYPYPLLRLLPLVCLALAAALLLRHGPSLAARWPALPDLLALGAGAAWLAAVLLAARSHLTLAVPSVENDFRVFALRSAHLAGQFPAGTTDPARDGVLRADGFYNLGYPLLLWLARPLAGDNPFLAGRLVAAGSGALLLLAGWLLALRLLGGWPALLALALLALSPLVVQQSLYLGTDMPFAACCALALALLVPGPISTTEARRHGETSTSRLKTVSGRDNRRPTTDDAQVVSGRSPVVGQMRRGLPPSIAKSRSVEPRIGVRKPCLRICGSMAAALLRINSSAHRYRARLATWRCLAAGFVAGLAFLMRHPGLLLLPFGLLALALQGWRAAAGRRALARRLLLFALAFGLAVAPQLAVNLRDTGQPLYSQQAKNIWQAVFGAGDWGRWAEAQNEIGLLQVLAQDPGRFLANWANNVRGYLGTGGEDPREFGQAVQLRLLGFPANWLALAGLLSWLTTIGIAQTAKGAIEASDSAQPTADCRLRWMGLLLGWLALYVVALSVGLPWQGRFAVGLAPIYALAGAWVLERLGRRMGARAALGAGMLLLALLAGGFRAGASYALAARPADEPARARAEGRAEQPGQPADELAIVERALARLGPGERVLVRVPPRVPIGKYSALAHLAAPAPAGDTPAELRATGAAYLIWSSELGPPPALGDPLEQAGPFSLYRLAP